MSKILIIDDNKNNLTLLEVLLKKSYPDYKILTSQSGPEGIEKVKKELPCVIILDVRMPEMDGYEVCKRLQSDEYIQHIPIILLTAYGANSKDIVRGLESGAISFISKPVEKDELIAQVNVALRITEAENKLIKAEKKYRSLIENAEEGIFQSTSEGRFLLVNSSLVNMMGYDSAEELMNSITNIASQVYVQPEQREKFKQKLEKEGRLTKNEFQIYRKDGSKMWISENSRAIYRKDGSLDFYEGIVSDITERKEAEAKIKESEEKFREIFEFANDGIIYMDKYGKILDVNAKVIEFYEGSKEELIGKNFTKLKIISRDYVVKLLKAFKTAMSKDAYSVEFDFINRKGKKVYLDCSSRIIKQNGKTISLIIVMRDVTERKQAEETLRESEKKFMNLIESAGDIIYLVDNNLSFLYANSKYLERRGITQEELLGKEYRDFHTDEGVNKFMERLKAIRKSGKPIVYEYQSEIDGKYFLRTLSPITNPETKGVESITVISRDITGRKNAEQELKDAEEKYRTVFENTGTAMVIIEQDTTILLVNKEFEKLSGFSKKEIEGKKFWTEFIVEEDLDEMKKQHDLRRKEPEAALKSYEFKFIDRNKKVKNIELNVDMIPETMKSVASLNDITERKQAEAMLLESEKKFRNLVESAGDIIYLVDKNLRFIYGNRKYLKRRGITQEELLGKEYGAFHSNEGVNKFKKRIEGVRKSGKPIVYEYQSEIDGKYFLRTLSPIKDTETNEVESITVISRDITDRKKAEETLRQYDNEIRTITNNIPALISYLDKKGHYRFVNKEYEKWFGIPKAKIIGKHYREILGEDVYRRIKNYVETALSGRSVSFDEELNYARVGTRWISAQYIPDFAGKGKVLGFFALVTDITERKRMSEKLRMSEERYRGLADSITDVFFAFDKNLKYTYWNKASEKLTGVAEKHAIGKQLLEIFPDTPQTRQAEHVYKDVLKNRKVRTFINDYSLGDKNFVFEINVYPAEDGISVFVKDITERKKIETDLHDSRQMLQTILDSIPAAVFWKDRDLFYLGCNRTFLDTVGMKSSEEVVGKNDYDLPGDKEMANSFREYDKRIMKSGIPEFDIIEQYVRSDGTNAWAKTNKVPLRDMEGNIVGILGTYEDITKRKQAEEALLTSEAQLSNAMKIARLGYWEYDLAKDMFTFNDHFYSIFRTSAEQVGGYTMSSARYAKLFAYPEDRQGLSNEIRKAIETTDPDYSGQIEHRMMYADGEPGYIAVRFFIVKDDLGRTVKTYGANQDITERKQVEEALREAKEFQSTLLNYSPNPIIVIEPDTTIKYVNPALEKLTGFKSDELVGKKAPYPFWAEELLEEIGEDLEKAMKKGAQGLEELFQKKNGEKFKVEITSSPIKENGELQYYLANWINITKRKQAEEELKKKMNQLERFNRLMVDRELRMVELKKEINELLEKAGSPKKYATN